MSIPKDLMSIRNPNSTLFYIAHSRSPVTMCTAPRSIRFSAPKIKMFARADGSFTGLRFGFSSPCCSEVLINRSILVN
ncbi:Protein FATTY ACID EXPORT 3 [Cardamine amara subsp. amara]|uniref:Protein FATTY ACID EXPORT 3 n=1 Tax=Cardamine amara subsp. amara TaxID=228776 RepID=A0ABD0ZXX3_CARAN